MVHVPETKDTRASKNLDWLGAALTVIGLGGLTFGLIQGPAVGWTSTEVLLTLIVGTLALVTFPLVELRVSNPMVPLWLFKSSNFTGSNLATLGVYFSFSGLFLFLILKLQQVQGTAGLQAGAAMLPVTILLLLLSPRVGGLIGRWGARVLMGAGAAIVCSVLCTAGIDGSDPPYWTQLFPTVIVLAIGMCLFITPLTATVMGAVPPDSVGVASGINNAVSRVAALLSIASWYRHSKPVPGVVDIQPVHPPGSTAMPRRSSSMLVAARRRPHSAWTVPEPAQQRSNGHRRCVPGGISLGDGILRHSLPVDALIIFLAMIRPEVVPKTALATATG